MWHEDILFFWDCSNCITPNKIQVGDISGVLGAGNTTDPITDTFPLTGGINNGPYFNNGAAAGTDTHELKFPVIDGVHYTKEQGSILIWFEIVELGEFDTVCGFSYDIDNKIELTLKAEGRMYWKYEGNNIGTISEIDAIGETVIDTVYCVGFHWDGTNQWTTKNGALGKDGIEEMTNDPFVTAPDYFKAGSGSSNNSSSVKIYRIQVTNNPYTLHVNIVRIIGSGVKKLIG